MNLRNFFKNLFIGIVDLKTNILLEKLPVTFKHLISPNCRKMILEDDDYISCPQCAEELYIEFPILGCGENAGTIGVPWSSQAIDKDQTMYNLICRRCKIRFFTLD